MNALAIPDTSCFTATKIMYRNTPSTKNCQFVIQDVNDTFLNNKTESQSDIVIVKVLENNNWGSFTSFSDRIKTLTSIEDILKLSKKQFSNKEELIKRVNQLIDLYDEDDINISINSLKSLFIFFAILNSNFRSPSITLNENGTFQINWKKDSINFITLRFRDLHFADYLVFKPSDYLEKPIILNGSMSLFDFVKYIKDLKLIYLIKDE
jgi:hypothetical protein